MRVGKAHIRESTLHQYVMPNMEVILNPKVLRFGNRSLDKFLKNSFQFLSFWRRKDWLAGHIVLAAVKLAATQWQRVSRLLYESMSFFTASESEKSTLNSDNKFSILEAKLKALSHQNLSVLPPHFCMTRSGTNHFFFPNMFLKSSVCCESHSHPQTDLLQFDRYREVLLLRSYKCPLMSVKNASF